MANVCPYCGTENRETAKFCIGCARALVEVQQATDGTAFQDTQPRRRRRKRRRRSDGTSGSSAGTANSARRPGFWLALGAAAIVMFGWAAAVGWKHGHPAADKSAVTATAESPPAPETAASAPAPGPANHASGAALSLDQAVANLAALQASASARASKDASETHPAQAPRAKDRKAAAKPPARPAGPPAPVVTEVAPAPPPAPASAPKSPASAPAPRALCGDGNFFTRGACLTSECAKPGMASHPACVQLRQQQSAPRRGVGEF